MIDFILLGLCLYSVGVTMLYLTGIKKRIGMMLALTALTSTLKDLAEGEAELYKTTEGNVQIRKVNK